MDFHKKRHAGAYFVNRPHNRWKEETFSFPKPPKKKKSIKKSSRKSKKSEISPKNIMIFQKYQNFRKFSENFMIFRIFFQIFSIFEMNFLWISIIFGVLERKMSPLSRKYYVYLRNMLPQVLSHD